MLDGTERLSGLPDLAHSPAPQGARELVLSVLAPVTAGSQTHYRQAQSRHVAHANPPTLSRPQ
jgi:hypothetical protein